MPEQIGNAGHIAIAWTERIMFSLAHQDERGVKLNKFTKKHRSLVNPVEPFDLSPHTEGLGVLAYGLNHIVPQIQRRGLPNHGLVSWDSSLIPATINRTYSDVGMVLPAPAENMSLTVNVPQRELQARNNITLAAENSGKEGVESSPYIDLAKIADKVYQLIRSDLVLERERTI